MKYKKIVVMVFYNSQGKILLQNRKLISKHGEEWGFFGGHIEKGETPKKALIREIKEELTYDLKDFKFFKQYGPIMSKDNSCKVTHLVFLSRLPAISQFKQNEGSGMKMFTIKESKKLKLAVVDDKFLDDLEFLFKNGEVLK